MENFQLIALLAAMGATSLNVTSDGFRVYIETFIGTLNSVAEQSLPPEHRAQLLHSSLLPARIKGYVSTQLGVAIEYDKANETTIEIVRGSARVEHLLLNAPPNTRLSGPMFNIEGAGNGFAKLTLSGAFPFRLTAKDASVTLEDVGLDISNWKRVIHFAEVFGNRDAEFWTIGKAESRAKDEVLAALVQLSRATERKTSISKYIEHFKNRTVLVLGDYDSEGDTRLDAITGALISGGYEPILIKNIPDHPHHDLPQKVVAIGAICRFVIIDGSSKSGHLLEVQLCKQNNWVTVLLRADGVGGSWMTAGASHTSNVILEMPYNPASPSHGISQAVQWAEAKLLELERKFEQTYPWRARS